MQARSRSLRNTLLPPVHRSIPFIDENGPFTRENLEIAPSAGTVKDLGIAGTD